MALHTSMCPRPAASAKGRFRISNLPRNEENQGGSGSVEARSTPCRETSGF